MITCLTFSTHIPLKPLFSWHSVYFAVITLTTAGLGDYVPTTDANKIICSIFIYFGVACIGLLLGSYIANMLDDRAYRDAKRKQIDSCPNCARLMNVREVAENISSAGKKSMSTMSPGSRPSIMKAPIHLSMRQVVNEGDSVGAVYIPRHNHQRYEGRHHNRPTPSTPHNSENLNNEMPTIAESFQVNTGMKGNEESPANHIPPPPPPVSVYSPSMSPGTNQSILGSPLTRQILGRQKHTRHQSFDISNVSWNPNLRKFSAEAPSAQTPPAISEDVPMNPPNSAPNPAPQVPFQGQGGYSLRGSEFIGDDNYESTYEDEDGYSEYSSEDESASTIDEIVDDKVSKIKAAKYVFLTLKQALVNSMVIIAVGCIGFVLTEEFNLVDSWYFVSNPSRRKMLMVFYC